VVNFCDVWRSFELLMIFSGELSYEWEVQKVLFFVFSDTVSTPASTEVPEVCSSVTTTYSASTHMHYGSFSL